MMKKLKFLFNGMLPDCDWKIHITLFQVEIETKLSLNVLIIFFRRNYISVICYSKTVLTYNISL